MLATVRNRRALITAVEPSVVTGVGVWHLVDVDKGRQGGVLYPLFYQLRV
jgi:hypothetical protein